MESPESPTPSTNYIYHLVNDVFITERASGKTIHADPTLEEIDSLHAYKVPQDLLLLSLKSKQEFGNMRSKNAIRFLHFHCLVDLPILAKMEDQLPCIESIFFHATCFDKESLETPGLNIFEELGSFIPQPKFKNITTSKLIIEINSGNYDPETNSSFMGRRPCQQIQLLVNYSSQNYHGLKEVNLVVPTQVQLGQIIDKLSSQYISFEYNFWPNKLAHLMTKPTINGYEPQVALEDAMDMGTNGEKANHSDGDDSKDSTSERVLDMVNGNHNSPRSDNMTTSSNNSNDYHSTDFSYGQDLNIAGNVNNPEETHTDLDEADSTNISSSTDSTVSSEEGIGTLVNNYIKDVLQLTNDDETKLENEQRPSVISQNFTRNTKRQTTNKKVSNPNNDDDDDDVKFLGVFVPPKEPESS